MFTLSFLLCFLISLPFLLDVFRNQTFSGYLNLFIFVPTFMDRTQWGCSFRNDGTRTRGCSETCGNCGHWTVKLSHVEGLGIEKCHGSPSGVKHAMGAIGKGDHATKGVLENVMTPMAARSVTPSKESFQGRMVLHNAVVS